MKDALIVISYSSEVLGSDVFWTGKVDEIDSIRNIVARGLATKTARDGQRHSDGMWNSEIARSLQEDE